MHNHWFPFYHLNKYLIKILNYLNYVIIGKKNYLIILTKKNFFVKLSLKISNYALQHKKMKL